ncbi:hypothetical protein [Enterobacter kobei]|uniref:hypothetical protein n=1 Tax=Enterobacter kobei TaxID=208224 RepID=UPI001E51B00F|nr:hypothetical protein [Enterobacter kobei]MCE1262992.1 hypothetical protein [Enterobacter kobei]MCE1359519.1 hypothetical protein [Enterobacter kobei]
MTNSSDLIICGFGGLSLVCGMAIVVLSFLNKKRFSAICALYREKFGSLPVGAVIFDKADSIGFSSGYAAKINFIVNPLIFGKSSVDSTNDDVSFIRGLPPHLTSPQKLVRCRVCFFSSRVAVNHDFRCRFVLPVTFQNQASYHAGLQMIIPTNLAPSPDLCNRSHKAPMVIRTNLAILFGVTREWKTVCIKDGIQSAAKAVTQSDVRHSHQQFNALINNVFYLPCAPSQASNQVKRGPSPALMAA